MKSLLSFRRYIYGHEVLYKYMVWRGFILFY
jgi:hypothetical protein